MATDTRWGKTDMVLFWLYVCLSFLCPMLWQQLLFNSISPYLILSGAFVFSTHTILCYGCRYVTKKEHRCHEWNLCFLLSSADCCVMNRQNYYFYFVCQQNYFYNKIIAFYEAYVNMAECSFARQIKCRYFNLWFFVSCFTSILRQKTKKSVILLNNCFWRQKISIIRQNAQNYFCF